MIESAPLLIPVNYAAYQESFPQLIYLSYLVIWYQRFGLELNFQIFIEFSDNWVKEADDYRRFEVQSKAEFLIQCLSLFHSEGERV